MAETVSFEPCLLKSASQKPAPDCARQEQKRMKHEIIIILIEQALKYFNINDKLTCLNKNILIFN